MKTKEVVALLKEGKRPMVRLTECLWEDSWGQQGMLARITSWKPDPDDLTELTFDYNEKKAHNMAIQPLGWYLDTDGHTGTAFEAGKMDEKDIKETVVFGETDDVPVEMADSPILAEYLKSGSTLPYVAWLEKFIEDNVPDCMKPWEHLA